MIYSCIFSPWNCYGQVATYGLWWTSFSSRARKVHVQSSLAHNCKVRGSTREIPRQTQLQHGTLNWGGEQEHRIWGELGTQTFQHLLPLWCTVCTKWAKRGQPSKERVLITTNTCTTKGLAPITWSKGMLVRWHPWRVMSSMIHRGSESVVCPCNESSCTCLNPKI